MYKSVNDFVLFMLQSQLSFTEKSLPDLAYLAKKLIFTNQIPQTELKMF